MRNNKVLVNKASTRSIALATLLEVLDRGKNLDSALEVQLPRLVDPRDRALAQRLAYGVLRQLGALDFLLGGLLKKPLRAKDQDVYLLLLLGLEQLWLESMPEHAVVYESAQVAKQRHKPWAVGLVNAVLRNFQRQRDSLLERLSGDPLAASSHPQWLLGQMQQDWPDCWRELVSANNHPAPMWLRVNRQSGTAQDYAGQFAEQLGPVSFSRFAPDAICLGRAMGVEALPGFATGQVSVQDPAAQLAVELMKLAPEQRVLDACAAPGGKTLHMLERQPQLGQLLAIDSSETRLQRLQENLARAGLQCGVECADATRPESWWDQEPFDRILLDAPCSGTGVIRRHPDIKWLRQADDLPGLVRQQAQLLNSLWPLLKPGGMLVYATCSIIAAENQELINGFIDGREDVSVMPAADHYGLQRAPGVQLLPNTDASDGFFYAVLQKIS